MSSRTLVQLAALAAFVLAAATQAATPPAGSVNGTSTETTWQGAVKLPTGKATCAGPGDPACDNYTLTIGDPGVPFQVTITLDPSGGDWDAQLYDASGALVDDSGNNPTVPEIMQVSIPGTYTVAAAPFAPALAGAAAALASSSTNVVAVHSASTVADGVCSVRALILMLATLMIRGNLLTRSRNAPRS